MNQQLYLLFPNVFIILVSQPGRCRKSTAIRLARQLLYDIPGVHIGPDSVTRAELISYLSQINVEGQSALTLHSTELSSLLEPSGIQMIQLLTDLYDCDVKPWKYATKGSGKYDISAPYLTMLAATTPSYIAEGLPESIVGHGFTSRVIFVYEDRERFLNPFPKGVDAALVTALKHDLEHISQLKGEFRWTSEARSNYEHYYKNISQTEHPDHRVEGFHNRKSIHVLKLAMLCSLAEKDDLIIKPEDIGAAEQIIDLIEPKMARTFTAVGKYQHALDIERMHSMILKAGEHGVLLSEIYRSSYHVGSPAELEEMVKGLISMGTVRKDTKDKQIRLIATRKQALWD